MTLDLEKLEALARNADSVAHRSDEHARFIWKDYDEAFRPHIALALIDRMRKAEAPLTNEEVEWVTNDIAELGVRVRGRCFFMYKGRSYQGGSRWRAIYKREYGEVAHPPLSAWRRPPDFETYVGAQGDTEDEWKPIEGDVGDEPEEMTSLRAALRSAEARAEKAEADLKVCRNELCFYAKLQMKGTDCGARARAALAKTSGGEKGGEG